MKTPAKYHETIDKQREFMYTPKQIADFIYKGKVWANVTSVARSWMSRNMEFFVFFPNWWRINITTPIAIMTGNNLNKNWELHVSWCGMDMCFSVLYNFFYGYQRYVKSQGKKSVMTAVNWNQKYHTI